MAGMAAAPNASAANLSRVGGFVARDCVEVSAIVTVPSKNARNALPVGFRSSSFLGLPGGPSLPGNSSLLMGVETCASGTIDGVDITGPFSFGERVLSVDRHDSTPGYHFYAIEQVSDNRAIVDLLSSAGFDIAFVPGVGAAADARGGTSNGGEVRIVDRAPLPRLPSPLSTVSIWKNTDVGTSLLRLTVEHPTAQAGLGTVTATTGSRISTLMGRQKAYGIGAINRFDFRADVFVSR